MAQRIEWRFGDESVLGLGNWYLDWGDPVNEQLVTLTGLIAMSENPVWCMREHANILGTIMVAVEDLLEDLAGIVGPGETPVQLLPDSPMEFAVARASQSLQHALALFVDALVECRKGTVQQAMESDPALSSSIAFVLSDALNACYRLAMHLPDRR